MKTVYIQCDYLLGCAGPSGELSYYTLYTDLIHDPIVVSDIIRLNIIVALKSLYT